MDVQKWLSGKKTYLVAAVVGIVAALQAAGQLDAETAEKAYGLLGALGLVTLRQGVAKVAPVLLACVWLGTGCAGFVGTTDMRAIDPATGAVTAEADCKGVGWSFGQSDVGDGCVGGEAISTPGADLLSKALGAVGAALKGMGAGLGG